MDELDLSFNQLTAFPDDLRNRIPLSLKKLWLQGNPFIGGLSLIALQGKVIVLEDVPCDVLKLYNF